MIQRRALFFQIDGRVRVMLRRELARMQFQSIQAMDETDLWARLSKDAFELIVLDGRQTRLDVTVLCRALRRSGVNQHAAIIVISTSNVDAERTLTLSSGADDYVLLPFDVHEFRERIRALMRGFVIQRMLGTDALGHVAELTLDPDRRTARFGGVQIDLTRREFDLLYLLLSSPGVTFSRSELVQRLGVSAKASPRSVIDPLVSQLRLKLRHAGGPGRLIRTVRGTGYALHA